MFSNDEIIRIAMEQSAIDSNCKREDFLQKDNVIVNFGCKPGCKKILKASACMRFDILWK